MMQYLFLHISVFPLLFNLDEGGSKSGRIYWVWGQINRGRIIMKQTGWLFCHSKVW